MIRAVQLTQSVYLRFIVIRTRFIYAAGQSDVEHRCCWHSLSNPDDVCLVVRAGPYR